MTRVRVIFVWSNAADRFNNLRPKKYPRDVDITNAPTTLPGFKWPFLCQSKKVMIEAVVPPHTTPQTKANPVFRAGVSGAIGRETTPVDMKPASPLQVPIRSFSLDNCCEQGLSEAAVRTRSKAHSLTRLRLLLFLTFWRSERNSRLFHHQRAGSHRQ
jgi:hypothetical protein